MVDWRKLPKADWEVADPKSLPNWARGPEIQRELRGEMLRALPVILAGVGVPFGIAFTLFALYAPSGTGTVANWIGLGALIGVPFSLITVGRWGEEWSGRRLRRRVQDQLEARGESVLGGEVVGVTYSHTVWRDSLHGDSWDWGVLHLEMDRLSFVGRGSKFDLRPESIQNMEIKQLSHAFGTQTRLFITWEEGGKSETLIFELPYQRSRRKRFEEIDYLRERIERWRREPLPLYDKTPLTPPTRQEELKPTINPYTQIGWPARILAGVSVAFGWVAFELFLVFGLMALGVHNFGSYLGGVSVLFWVAWIFAAGAIEKRLPAKWQHPEKQRSVESEGVIGLEAPRSEEERANLTA